MGQPDLTKKQKAFGIYFKCTIHVKPGVNAELIVHAKCAHGVQIFKFIHFETFRSLKTCQKTACSKVIILFTHVAWQPPIESVKSISMHMRVCNIKTEWKRN